MSLSVSAYEDQCLYEDFLMQITAYSLIWVALQKQIDAGTRDYLYHSESSSALLNDVCLFLCSFLLSLAL